MTETQKLALKMIADPDLCDADWESTIKRFRLSRSDDVDGEQYCSVFYSQWIYARLAKLILDGDDEALLAFIEKFDSQRLVRDKIEKR